ncbi:putative oxidoreductase CzcO [Anatilimnocola aggregata]|uniref:Putative oxidoreductase CzcO n=1 Tax=Anatilimnocola aggregata TaxID=2528021 RepID=A0A517YE53_9BACT|nr:NAD(P)-binding domain-containing protein [Anatilimnocola aggregata]QDU28442.1 putative oxidoreductase CzcO [Anatilimnocola aggregata]
MSDTFAIIGAGPAGLATAKNFSQLGLQVELLEREDDVGGNWYFGRPASSVCHSTHMISSKRMSQLADFPMPKDYPPYPHHRQVLTYLRDYARHFGLYHVTRFQTEVRRIELAVQNGSGEHWQVTLENGEVRTYAGVVIASGHHHDPLWPDLPGNFSGQVLHARDYKTPEQIRGQRVLVIGGGNSGCDLAVEAAQHGSTSLLSLRRGYHFLPKFLFGGPLDAGGELFDRWRVPIWLQQQITAWFVKIAVGRPERYGLPKPDHRLFETHPIVNSQLLYAVGHGHVQVRPAIENITGNRVRFVDGREEDIDVILCATGYKTTFPFLDPSLLMADDGSPRLFLNAFHPQHDRLFVAGLIQPNGSIWPLVDWQSRLMAKFVRAQESNPQKADWFRQLKSRGHDDLGGGIRYDRSPRHSLEVEFFAYRRRLKTLVSSFG